MHRAGQTVQRDDRARVGAKEKFAAFDHRRAERPAARQTQIRAPDDVAVRRIKRHNRQFRFRARFDK